MSQKLSRIAEIVLNRWTTLEQTIGRDGTMPRDALVAFVADNFEQPGGELESCTPSDYKDDAEFETIPDASYRSWAKALHALWPTLTRRVAEKVHTAPERYSLLALPEPFVVPGGRFREIYYWDSFFAIKGLLVSNMLDTVRKMITNMGYLIETYGFVPNGNRLYYLTRSQPRKLNPFSTFFCRKRRLFLALLTWCLHAYYEKSGDLEFVKRAMPWLEREMEYFKVSFKYRAKARLIDQLAIVEEQADHERRLEVVPLPLPVSTVKQHCEKMKSAFISIKQLVKGESAGHIRASIFQHTYASASRKRSFKKNVSLANNGVMCARRPAANTAYVRSIFSVVATSPRPESYREDVESAEHLSDETRRQELYGEIAAAAESGRDFSARWFSTEGERAGTMSSTRTSRKYYAYTKKSCAKMKMQRAQKRFCLTFDLATIL